MTDHWAVTYWKRRGVIPPGHADKIAKARAADDETVEDVESNSISSVRATIT